MGPNVCVSHSVVSNSLRFRGLEPARLLCPWDFPGKHTGTDSHSLLQGIFPTHGSNPSLLPCKQILYHLSHQRSPSGAQCKIKVGAPYAGGFSFSDYRALNQACALLLRAWSPGLRTAGQLASPNSFSVHPFISSLYTRTHLPSTPHPTSLTPQLCPQKRGIDIFPEENLSTCANYEVSLQNHCRWWLQPQN